MNPVFKWIGGAAAVVALALGGATLASGMLADTPNGDAAAGQPSPQFISEEVVQPIPDENAEASSEERGPADQAAPDTAAEAFVIKRILPIDGPIKYGEWHWDDEGIADGPVVMTVDLKARVISVFQGGYEVGAAAVLLGTDEHPTPLGTFPIRHKMRHNVSEKYNNAPMPYSMFLTADGVALHGSEVENGYASHGCVGMPDDFAAKIFAIAKKGDKVIITDGKTIGMGDSIL